MRTNLSQRLFSETAFHQIRPRVSPDRTFLKYQSSQSKETPCMFLDNTNPSFEHAEPSYTQKSTHAQRGITGEIQAERNRPRVMMKKLPSHCLDQNISSTNSMQARSCTHRESQHQTHLLILSLMLSELSYRGSLRQRQADLDWHARNVSHFGRHDRICDCAITRSFPPRWEHMCYLFQNGRKSQTRH